MAWYNKALFLVQSLHIFISLPKKVGVWVRAISSKIATIDSFSVDEYYLEVEDHTKFG